MDYALKRAQFTLNAKYYSLVLIMATPIGKPQAGWLRTAPSKIKILLYPNIIAQKC